MNVAPSSCPFLLTRRLAPAIMCLAGLLSIATAQDIPRHVATIPAKQTEAVEERMERQALINTHSKKKDTQLVFVGDSLTQMWETDDAGKPTWNKYWVPLKVANYGVSGDRTEHVLWRLDNGNLDGLQPKLIVLLIGTNNAGQQFEVDDYHCSPQQTADGIRAILAKLKTKCPSAKILLLGILPRGEEETDRVRVQTNATNKIIRTYADETTIFFLDVGAKLLKPNGDGNVMIQPDMLHLSAQGYQILADAIAPTVKRLMQ